MRALNWPGPTLLPLRQFSVSMRATQMNPDGMGVGASHSKAYWDRQPLKLPNNLKKNIMDPRFRWMVVGISPSLSIML